MLLLNKLKASKEARIINISSKAHTATKGLDFSDLQLEKTYSSFGAYANSKLANIYFTKTLSKLLESSPHVKVCSVHPGAVRTEVARYV